NSFQNNYMGETDGFVAKLNAELSEIVYCGFVGGASEDMVHSIKVNTQGQLFGGGQTRSNDLRVTSNRVQLDNGGGIDGMYFSVRENGATYAFLSYLGGSEDDIINGIDINVLNELYIIGSTLSASFPLAPVRTQGGGWGVPIVRDEPYQSENSGGWEVFISKVRDGG